jgi:hypothetical protein
MKIVPTVIALAVAGCSTASKDITPTAVSPLQYQPHSCEQLAAESNRINTRAAALGGRLDRAASNDVKLGWATALLFWPAMFWMGGTKEQEAEYAQLKGESAAIQQAAIMKNCGTAVAPVVPVVTEKQQIIPTPGPTTPTSN